MKILNRGTHDMYLRGKIRRGNATRAKVQEAVSAPRPAPICITAIVHAKNARGPFGSDAAFSFEERQIAVGLCLGMSNTEIAEALDTTERAVRMSVWRLMNKTGMGSRVEFVVQQNAAARESVWGAQASPGTAIEPTAE